jgi:hypothetical protein
VFGSAGGRPTTRQVRAALEELGVGAKDLMLAPDQPRGATRMVASDDRGAIEVRVLGRAETDSRLLSKFWRSVLYRDGGPTLHLTRLEDVSAEAYAAAGRASRGARSRRHRGGKGGLSREIRPPSRHGRRRAFAKHLAGLRSCSASTLGTTVPPLQDMYRVKASNPLIAVGTLFGLSALFSQVGSPSQLWSTVSGAQFGWLVAALAGTLPITVPSAIGLMGAATIRLPLISTTELQVSMAFANLAVPAVGGTASQLRFLQRQGMDLPAAVATGPFLASLGGAVAQLLLLGVAISLAPNSYSPPHIDIRKIASVALIALVAFVAIVGLMLGVPRIRKHVLPPTRNALSAVWSVLRSPHRLALLLGSSILIALMTAGVHEACLAAFRASANFWTLPSLLIVISAIASLVPTPGGPTAVTSVGMSGALTAADVPTEAAVAAARRRAQSG